jgi:hypothetical protein
MKTIGGFGTLSIVGGRNVQGQPEQKERPNTYDKRGTQGTSFEDPAYFRHVADLPSARGRLRRYERTGETASLLTPHLHQKIQTMGLETVDIQVQTTGRRNRIVSNGPYGRQLFGWQPTPNETKRLGEFGTVRETPNVASTNVGVSDVSTDDLAEIADLPFVLEIGADPTVSGRNSTHSLKQSEATSSVSTTSSTLPWVGDIEGSAHSAFDSVSHSLDSDLRVGFFIGKYDKTGGASRYDTNWGKKVGINSDLAKDFTDSGGWQGGENSHSTDVLNTTARFLTNYNPTGDPLVPLRVWEEGTENIRASNFSNAIDYALTNDIAVSVTAVLITDNVSYCPSTVCSELESYTDAGYAMVVASGNQGDEKDGVDDPSQSYHTIGVGGYSGSCSGGKEHETSSQYDEVMYHDSGLTYCSWCYDGGRTSKFTPDVHSCYSFYPTSNKDNELLYGTSFSAPVVAAGTAVHASANGAVYYSDHLQKYHQMNNHNVCPSSPSQLGQVLHMPDID